MSLPLAMLTLSVGKTHVRKAVRRKRTIVRTIKDGAVLTGGGGFTLPGYQVPTKLLCHSPPSSGQGEK